jgi:hypothetical protein
MSCTFGVDELERLSAQRLERGDLLLGLQLDLLLGVQLVLGGDQDDVARLAQPRFFACRMMSSAWSQGTSFRRA